MRCLSCGAELQSGVRFCSKCGSPVAQSGAVPSVKKSLPHDISKVWPEWQLEKQLGKGSYGVVYQAVRRDSNVESHAAIKIVSIPTDSAEIDSLRSEGLDLEGTRTYLKGIVDEFVGEIQLMETLKGIQNIVSVEDYKVVEKTDEIGWDIYIRMELLTPFSAYICDKALSEEDVIRLGSDICSALEICSKRNVIHRDIKPENIFVNDFGYFKLGDFGIARKLENVSGGLSQKGTFNYMAPEVATSNEYDARVDIYSLGIVLYRLLNGNRLPFIDNDKQLLSPNERKMAVERRIRGDQLPAPCNASPAMADVILRACAHNPAARYATATEFKKALKAVENGTYVPMVADIDKTTSVRASGAKSAAPVAPVAPVTPNAPATDIDKTTSVRSTAAAASAAPKKQPAPPPPKSKAVAAPPAKKEGKKKLWLILLIAVAVIAVAVILALIVVNGDDSSSSGKTKDKNKTTTTTTTTIPNNGGGSNYDDDVPIAQNGVINELVTREVYQYYVDYNGKIGEKETREITYKGTVRIGNTAATTGAFAQVGDPFNKGLEAYINKVNYNGGLGGDYDSGKQGYYIEFIHYDDGFQADTGSAYTKKLVEEDKVFALVGHFGSPVVGATVEYIKQQGVIACYFASGVGTLYNTEADSIENGSTLFPVQPIYATEGRIIVGRIIEQYPNAKKIGIVYTNNEAGEGLKNGATAQIDMLGGDYSYVLSEVSTYASDYTPAVTKVTDCDVVIVAAIQTETVSTIKAMIANGIYKPCFTTYSVASNQTLIDIKPAYDTLSDDAKANLPIYTNTWLSSTDLEGFAEFATDIIAYTGENTLSLNSYTMAGWIAAQVFCEGAERVLASGMELTTQAFVEAMESAKVELPLGEFSYDCTTYLDYSGGMRLGTTTMALLKNNENCNIFEEVADAKDFRPFIESGDIYDLY